MRHIVLAFLLSLLSTQVLAQDLRSQFTGKWRSDEAKTLEDMRKHPEVTEKARKLFENNFFGRLVLVVDEKQFASYWAEEEGKKALEFEQYQITGLGKDYIVVKATNKVLGTTEERRWYFENDYMYAYITKWNFREYFRKIK